MKRIKKLIAVLICSTFIFTPSISALAGSTDGNMEARGCAHSVLIFKDNTTGYECTESKHTYCLYQVYQCALCNYTKKEKVAEITSGEHSMSVTDLGHAGNQHTWRRSCSTCGYGNVITIACTGAGCRYPFSLLCKD